MAKIKCLSHPKFIISFAPMKIVKAYNKQDILKWTFAQVCQFRNKVWQTYLQYNEADMKMVQAGLKIIDSAYRVAVKVTLEGVDINEQTLADLKISEEDIKVITRYRCLIMSKMAALPPDVLRTMQILRTEFGNY